MNQLDHLHQINTYLTRFAGEIHILNANQDFSINIIAEDVLIQLLNKVYDLNLVNLNSRRKNYPAIDLLDESSRIAIQVTATADVSKIADGLEKFYRHELYQKADRLIFFILKEEAGLSQSAINTQIGLIHQQLAPDLPKISIDTKNDIWDFTSLFTAIKQTNDIVKINAISGYLKAQFDEITRQANLAPYYEKLKNMFLEVVMEDEKGMTLGQIYVDPSFSLHISAVKKEKRAAFSPAFLRVDQRYKLPEFIDDFLAHTNPLNCLTDPDIILLLGYPGQGKSSLIKKLLYEYISHERHTIKPCYYFPLRNISNAKNFISDPFKTLYEEVRLSVLQDLDYFAFSRSLLFLDGLDELYMKDSLRMEDIDRLVTDLMRLTQKLPGLQIILTSRSGYVDTEKMLKDPIWIVELSLFNLADQEKWLLKYLRFHPNSWVTHLTLQNIYENHNLTFLKELIQQPLLLYILASLPSAVVEKITRAGIYDQLFTVLIDRKYSRDGQLEIFRGLSKSELRILIREIAFAIHRSGDEHITKADLLKMEESRKFLARLPGENLRNSIKGIMIAFYFKEVKLTDNGSSAEDDGNYAIEFLHKSLREYMTAEKIAYTLIDEFLDKRKSSERYVLEDFDHAFSLLQSLFKHTISDEIVDHLLDILEIQTEAIKPELETRLISFFPDLLNASFLKDYDYREGKSPSYISANIFHGFWSIASHLGMSRNYLPKELRQSASNFLSQVSLSKGRLYRLRFDHQDFSTATFYKISFSNCSFFNTNFEGCYFFDIEFDSCSFDHVNFISCEFSAATFFHCEIRNCTFDGSKFKEKGFLNSEITDCSFSDIKSYVKKLFAASVYFTLNKVKNCSFKNAKLNPSTSKWLSRFSKQCDLDSIEQTLDPDKTVVAMKVIVMGSAPPIPIPPATDPSAENYKRLSPEHS